MATGRPEVAVGATAKGELSSAWFAMVANVIVWMPDAMLKLWSTLVAAK